MNRREFLNWIGVGALASSLPVAMAACHSTSEQSEPVKPELQTSDRENGYQALATVQELESRGQIVTENTAKPVLVFSYSDGTIAAVNPTCTHQGCNVEWQINKEIFACPCHGSQFGIGGEVIKGPATKPLEAYQTKREGDSILVKVS